MRDSLKASIADSPVRNFERYPKGSIVLCNACALPVFKLDRGIDLGQKAGGAASAFTPLTLADLNMLADRVDIDAGVRAVLNAWTLDQRRAHIASLREMRSGDPMICPACGDCFVQVLTREQTETIDKAYVLELLTIPPYGDGRPSPIRGKRFAGDRGDWVH